MRKIKISAVSYLNSLPFVYGLQHNEELNKMMDLSLDIPSVCARKLLNNDVDLGLVPVAIVPRLKTSEIVSDYCIGANGKVETVLLLSDVPKEDMQAVYLDYQSRTSVQLVQVLAREYWQVRPKWKQAEKGYESKVEPNDGAVIIGDRTFNLTQKYAYRYDLAEEWKKFTGLPFVFAAWVTNKKLPNTFVDMFNAALAYGIQNIPTVIDDYMLKNPSCSADLNKYLTQDIQYVLDDNKRLAMDRFWAHAAMNTVTTN